MIESFSDSLVVLLGENKGFPFTFKDVSFWRDFLPLDFFFDLELYESSLVFMNLSSIPLGNFFIKVLLRSHSLESLNADIGSIILKMTLKAPDIDEDDMQMIYNWVDEIPLSRPKKNIGRDFADGGKFK